MVRYNSLFNRRLLKWKEYLRKMHAATTIQRMIRGFLCRRLLKRWWERKLYLISIIQAIVRGHLVRKRWKEQLESLHDAATEIQRRYRGYLGRRQFKLGQQHKAVLTIQR